jgi:hypothetical protein
MDLALCLTLDILANLFNAFFLVHDSENPKFGSLNSRAGVHDHNILNLNINEPKQFQGKRLTTQRSFNK